MKITLRYFGMIAELIDKQSEDIDVQDDCTIQNLNEILTTKYDNLASYTYRYAVNEEMVKDEKKLSQNDEVILLPPFAGG